MPSLVELARLLGERGVKVVDWSANVVPFLIILVIPTTEREGVLFFVRSNFGRPCKFEIGFPRLLHVAVPRLHATRTRFVRDNVDHSGFNTKFGYTVPMDVQVICKAPLLQRCSFPLPHPLTLGSNLPQTPVVGNAACRRY